MEVGKVYDVATRRPLGRNAPFITCDGMDRTLVEGHWTGGAKPPRPIFDRNGDNVGAVYGDEDWEIFLPSDFREAGLYEAGIYEERPDFDDSDITKGGVIPGGADISKAEDGMFNRAAGLGWSMCGWAEAYAEWNPEFDPDNKDPVGIAFFGMK